MVGGSVGGGVVDVMLTVTDFEDEPPAPVHARVNVLAWLSAAVSSVPDTALAPVQAPEAVQLVAFVADQVSVDFPPAVTDVGLAPSVTIGAGVDAAATVTDAERLAVPPAPVHASVNVLF